MLNFLDNLFGSKYWWDFYRPINFTDKEWVCSRKFTAWQAMEFSRENSWIYEIRLTP